MKLIELINSEKALAKILDTEIKIEKAFELSKSIKKVNEELTVYNELRDKLIKKLGKEDKEKKTFQVTEENVPKFYEELSKLTEKEVKIKFPKLTAKDFEGGKIDTKTLLQLDYLFN